MGTIQNQEFGARMENEASTSQNSIETPALITGGPRHPIKFYVERGRQQLFETFEMFRPYCPLGTYRHDRAADHS